MSKIIELTETEVIIKEGENISAITIDENSAIYQQIKAETNNFTENMIQESKTESLERTQTDLIFQLMMKGVI